MNKTKIQDKPGAPRTPLAARRWLPRFRALGSVPRTSAMLVLTACACLCALAAKPIGPSGDGGVSSSGTLGETRLTMDKWIETQQIISKERKDWQQGKEILVGRLTLLRNEVAALEEKIEQAQAGVTEADRKRDELLAANEQSKTVGAQLATNVTAMEVDVKKLFNALPDPVQTRLVPLSQRIPDDPANTRVSVAERFQNVLGILNELNKDNNEITVGYEVHTLADNKPSEVQTLYIGLAQAYYFSAGGEAGIGRPSADGWKWEPTKAVAGDVMRALEILQGKHTPAFVALPVKIQ